MGNFINVGKRKATKSLKNYNIDSRVDKVLKQSKPSVAPRHKSVSSLRVSDQLTEEQTKQMKKDVFEANPELLKHLKEVYVVSKGFNPNVNETFKKPMPHFRGTYESKLYGYHTPDSIKYGKVSLQSVLQILTKYQEDPTEHSPKRLADEYKIDLGALENVLKYNFTFTLLFSPEAQKDYDHVTLPKALFSGAHKTVIIEDETEAEEIAREKKEVKAEIEAKESAATKKTPISIPINIIKKDAH